MRALLSWAVCSALAAGGLAVASPAGAVAFGPATTGFTFIPGQSPSFTYGLSSGTVTLGGTTRTTTPTGTFNGATSGGSAGTFTYTTTVGTTLFETLPGMFTFSDPAGGLFTFDGRSVETTAYMVDPVQDSITLSLYILGTTSGGNGMFGGTDTSVLFNLTGSLSDTTRSNISATLSNPPDRDPNPPAPPVPSVPEPAGMAVFGVGLLGLAAVRRVRAGRAERAQPVEPALA